MAGSPIEEIKARLDIVEFIQTYVRLHKAGMNLRAICPFHAEKTPSFFVSPTRQTWHCFGGCGEGGDIFKFVMKIEALDFPEALRLLARRAGVVLTREDPRIRSERNRLYDLCEEATKIFEKNLLLTEAAKSYVKRRGMTEDTVRGFRIGFAPQGWDGLLTKLAQKGFTRDEVRNAGLAVRSEDGLSHYDRFRSRIMFPISDGNGRVIGFGGRIFEEVRDKGAGDKRQEAGKTEAKYINTPQTLIYDKSRVLYGFDKAKQEIRSRGAALIVEGYMDCVMSHQAGVKHTIAVSGTALTIPQLTTVKRLCDTLIFSFDTDAAGETATRRSLGLVAGFDLDRRIAAIPSGKDPADAVLENPAHWIAAVREAKPVVDFYFEKAFREINPERAEGKKKISALLVPFIAELNNEVEKAHWVRELAMRFQIGEDAVWKEVLRRPGAGADPVARAGGEGKPSEEAAPSRRQLLEDRFLALLAVMPEEARTRGLEGHQFSFISPRRQEIFERFSQGVPASKDLAQEAEALRLQGEIVADAFPDVEKEFFICRKELEKECIREALITLGGRIRQQEAAGRGEELGPLMEDFHMLSQKLKMLSLS